MPIEKLFQLVIFFHYYIETTTESLKTKPDSDITKEEHTNRPEETTDDVKIVTNEFITDFPKDESTKDTGKELGSVTTEKNQQQTINSGALGLREKWQLMQTIMVPFNMLFFTVAALKFEFVHIVTK